MQEPCSSPSYPVDLRRPERLAEPTLRFDRVEESYKETKTRGIRRWFRCCAAWEKTGVTQNGKKALQFAGKVFLELSAEDIAVGFLLEVHCEQDH